MNIKTPKGTVQLLEPGLGFLRSIRDLMPFGALQFTEPQNGARYGLVMQYEQKEVFCIKQQSVELDRQGAEQCLEKKVAADDAEMLMKLVRACYALAFGLEPSEAEVGPFMPSLTHPDPAVWGPAFVYVRQLLPRFPRLRAAVHGLLDHPDPAVRLRLLHWQE